MRCDQLVKKRQNIVFRKIENWVSQRAIPHWNEIDVFAGALRSQNHILYSFCTDSDISQRLKNKSEFFAADSNEYCNQLPLRILACKIKRKISSESEMLSASDENFLSTVHVRTRE